LKALGQFKYNLARLMAGSVDMLLLVPENLQQKAIEKKEAK
jgi:hypothetical protein